ncbi:hypothetical protein [Cupriavidus sp. HPC(L)]|uniref:hypothetical protein n=1 Tax=Cupriavidus sp. HPC(L) TaxID=1217418 RepID=UPI0012EDDE81|nr:hypothetical protein [Cupriavidus sp. HPC(L)]
MSSSTLTSLAMLKMQVDQGHDYLDYLRPFNAERDEKLRIQQRLYWRCNRKAGYCAWAMSIGFVATLVVGLAASLGVKSENAIWNMTLPSTLAISFPLTLGNLVWGSTFRGFHQLIHDRCRVWFLKRESAALGIDISGIEK